MAKYSIKPTMLSLVFVEGMRGRWNLRCDPTAPGRGGADRLEATKLMVSTQSWHSLLSLKKLIVNIIY